MILEKQVNNAGLVWTQQINQIKDYWIRDILITPSGRIFVVTTEDEDKVLYTDDNGNTWTKCTSIDMERAEKLCITKTGRILAIIEEASSYFEYSDDNGVTWKDNWSLYNAGVEAYIGDLYSLSTGRLLMSAVEGGIWYSDDNGETWTQSNRTSGTYNLLKGTSLTGRLFIGHAIGTSASDNGIWYSDDNGETWTQSNKTDGTGKSLCVTPAGRIIVGNNSGIWYSDNNGVNWTQSNKTNGIWYDLYCTDSGRCLAGAYTSGIWYSEDNGVNWSLITDAYTTCNIIKLLDNKLIVGTNNGIWYSDIVTETQNVYSSKPLTGAQAKELVAQCKAYVQSLKNNS